MSINLLGRYFTTGRQYTTDEQIKSKHQRTFGWLSQTGEYPFRTTLILPKVSSVWSRQNGVDESWNIRTLLRLFEPTLLQNDRRNFLIFNGVFSHT